MASRTAAADGRAGARPRSRRRALRARARSARAAARPDRSRHAALGTHARGRACAGVASAGGLARARRACCRRPGIASLVRLGHADLGVVISASHNPSPTTASSSSAATGSSSTTTTRIASSSSWASSDLPTGAALGESIALQDAATRYADWVVGGARGRRSARRRDPRRLRERRRERRREPLFEELGVDADLCFASPDGLNINEHCGSTHLDVLSRGGRDGRLRARPRVRRRRRPRARRDADGVPVDGDQIVAILARDLQFAPRAAGRHRRRHVDVEPRLPPRDAGSRHRDRRRPTSATATCSRTCAARGAVLGGEQSGHVIALDHQTTGDGLITAALLLDALDRAGQPLAEAATLVRASRSGSSTCAPTARASPDARAIWEVVERESVAARRERRGAHRAARLRHRAARPRDGRARGPRRARSPLR